MRNNTLMVVNGTEGRNRTEGAGFRYLSIVDGGDGVAGCCTKGFPSR